MDIKDRKKLLANAIITANPVSGNSLSRHQALFCHPVIQRQRQSGIRERANGPFQYPDNRGHLRSPDSGQQPGYGEPAGHVTIRNPCATSQNKEGVTY